MDGNATSILDRYKIPRHRLTLDDYHRLGEAGILNEDDRVELLEGQLIDMSPIGPRHRFRCQTGSLCPGWHPGVLDHRPDNQYRAGLPRSGRRGL